MTSRSEDGLYANRGGLHGGRIGCPSEDDEMDVMNEHRDLVADPPLSTHPSIYLDHTPTHAGRMGPIMNFHTIRSNYDTATNNGG